MMRKWIKRIALGAGAAIAALLLIAVALYLAITGPRNLTEYPPREESPYLLPWPGGETRFCVQGNRAVASHRGREEFAFDFVMPVGSKVCAARAGVVSRVVEDHDGHGYKWPNNLVAVDHGDGTTGYYLHLKKDGALVNVGDHVYQGQVIAQSGHVGNSAMPHLHFHVADTETRKTLPITFADVQTDLGIPRMLKTYQSGNLPGGKFNPVIL
ncbi:MAG: peptidoglycan DD-metalloendopeptidase family protein [Candidatus Hydrogenedens sp.]|nr:peptidoglycan DD-metalloendopeptidase family protein [Candidatus Hydrogenedens sp.]